MSSFISDVLASEILSQRWRNSVGDYVGDSVGDTITVSNIRYQHECSL